MRKEKTKVLLSILKHFSDLQYLVGLKSWSSESKSANALILNLSDEEVMLVLRNLKKRDGRKKFKKIRHLMYHGVKRNSRK